MATVNLATKFSPKLDERYKLRSRTDAFTGTNWEWNGANAIKMWTLIAADLNDCVPIEQVKDIANRSFFQRLWESLVRLLSPLM